MGFLPKEMTVGELYSCAPSPWDMDTWGLQPLMPSRPEEELPQS